jgi:2-polyprenyl-3-methyl-5-hydroxy-6-metoxy-1,4-benzoquinol methylase
MSAMEHDSQGPAARTLTIDDIMWRVRSEVARRKGQMSVAASNIPAEIRPSDESLPKWKPAMSWPPVKDVYLAAELLAFSDVDFVDVAYRAVLRRPPDENALNHYLHLLRTGTASKIEILWNLSSSEEGRASAIRIDGLRLPYLLQQWRRKRFIGPVICWIHAFLRLGTMADRQMIQELNQGREMQEAGRLLNENSQYLMQRIADMKVQLTGHAWLAELEALKTKHEAAAARLAALDAVIHAKLHAHQGDGQRLETRLASVEASVQQLLAGDEAQTEAARALDSLYAAFEDRFRGDRSVVQARAEPYLAFVRESGAGTDAAPVIDIGCGRGEWLESLRANGLTGRGIDVNRVFIGQCRILGLDVIEGDAVESLRAMPQGSAGAITAMHVVEHLPFKRVIALLDEARRVLRPGGLIILETPNPENLSVAHLSFHNDPTHRNLLPPEALRWIVEARGFSSVRIERLTEARELNPLPLVPEDVPGAASINVVLALLNAAPDYAIVARAQGLG